MHTRIAAAQRNIKIFHFPGESNNKAKMTAIHLSNKKMFGKLRQITTTIKQDEKHGKERQ